MYLQCTPKNGFKMNKDDLFDTIEFSIYKGLLGETIPSLRQASFSWDAEKKLITIVFFHDGTVTSPVEDHYSVIATESDSAYFGKGIRLIHKVIRCDYPNQLPDNGHVVYRRKEPFIGLDV